jgi:hypothetical protein
MGRLIKVCLFDILIMSFAFAGILFDERFLDLYQFIMWSIVILAFIALIIPSEDLFKKETNSKAKNVINWFFSICKILVSVWVGMVFLAVFYLIISLFCYVKKQSYFDELLKVKSNE